MLLKNDIDSFRFLYTMATQSLLERIFSQKVIKVGEKYVPLTDITNVDNLTVNTINGQAPSNGSLNENGVFNPSPSGPLDLNGHPLIDNMGTLTIGGDTVNIGNSATDVQIGNTATNVGIGLDGNIISIGTAYDVSISASNTIALDGNVTFNGPVKSIGSGGLDMNWGSISKIGNLGATGPATFGSGSTPLTINGNNLTNVSLINGVPPAGSWNGTATSDLNMGWHNITNVGNIVATGPMTFGTGPNPLTLNTNSITNVGNLVATGPMTFGTGTNPLTLHTNSITNVGNLVATGPMTFGTGTNPLTLHTNSITNVGNLVATGPMTFGTGTNPLTLNTNSIKNLQYVNGVPYAQGGGGVILSGNTGCYTQYAAVETTISGPSGLTNTGIVTMTPTSDPGSGTRYWANTYSAGPSGLGPKIKFNAINDNTGIGFNFNYALLKL